MTDAQIKLYEAKYVNILKLYDDLLLSLNNITVGLDEYTRKISTANIFDGTRRTVLGNIAIKANLVNGLASQIRGFQDKLRVLYERGQAYITSPPVQPGDIATAQSVLEQFVILVDSSDAQIADYQATVDQLQKNIDDLGASIRNMLPDEPLMYKVEEDPPANLWKDPNIIVFLLIVIGLAMYYFYSWHGGYVYAQYNQPYAPYNQPYAPYNQQYVPRA